MVLNVQVQDLAGKPAVDLREAAGQQVQGVRGVPGKDHRIVCTSANEVTDDVPGILVDGGADLRGEACPAVNAGVVREDLVEVGGNNCQRRG
ncbi:hypothetical protein PJL18_02275 [Paenarthrobacter nicotinovorans]|nr:hypothetical protein [Paenarthrobacter nicotinovorans]